MGAEEIDAAVRVLRSGHLAQGVEVAAFEQEFSSLVDERRCSAVSSGTAALHIALKSAGVRPQDEVIVPSFTFAATANAVRLVGARPVFVDIDPATFCIDPAAVSAAIGVKTTAVIAVHLYGQPAPMRELKILTDRHGLLLVEDAAQAHGAATHGRPVGTWGDIAIFSFYATKNITTAGEGGMVVTASDEISRRARLLRNQGMERPYETEVVGFNLRMTEVAAAVGRQQLHKLPVLTEARQRNARFFDESLVDVQKPHVAAGNTHVYHQYTIRTRHREGLIQRLIARGVEYGIYYQTPVHRLFPYRENLELPETDRAADEVVSIPVGPHVDGAAAQEVAAAVNNA